MFNKIKGFLNDGHQSLYKKVASISTRIGLVLGMAMATTGNFLATYEVDTTGVAEAFKNTFNGVYGAIVGSATAIGVCIIACCLVTIMTTKNTRKIEEMMTWIKSICIAWICLMCASIVITFIKALVGSAIDGTADEPLFD